LNGTHQLLAYAAAAAAAAADDDDDILGGNINSTKKSPETLLRASRKVGLEVNTETTKYMVMTNQQTVEQNHNLLIDNKFFENVAKCKYLGTAVENENCIQEEIKSRLNSGNACYHYVQSPLSFRLLSEIFN
jgi:hypothetical protein